MGNIQMHMEPKIKFRMEMRNMSNKLIIDTKIKFCIYTRRAFRLQKTHQCVVRIKKGLIK